MPIKVLIIDDSALVRETLSQILNSDTDIKVIATASDPIFGAKKIKVERPDVIVLDRNGSYGWSHIFKENE